MKKRMKLSRETLRHLGDSAVERVAGGITGDFCTTAETCSYCGICVTDACPNTRAE